MAVVALISFIAISAGRETYQRDLDADSSSESAPAPG